MKQQQRIQLGFTLITLAALTSFPVFGADNLPDLTKGETKGVDRNGTYNLGATGLRGWIYTRFDSYMDGEHGRTTTHSRPILVMHVGARSPADA